MGFKKVSLMKVDRRKCSQDIIDSMKKGAVVGAKISAVSRVGRKLQGYLRSNVLRESD